MKRRTLLEYIVITLKGMAMGAADVVPGVSGGTIAFISGIYEELINTISGVNLDLIKILREEGLQSVWKKLNGNFLLALLIGIFISILSLAKLISWLLEHKPILVWSFFFGLVIASIIYIAKQITKWNFINILFLVLGAFVAYFITTLTPTVTEDTSPFYMFMAGAIAICAMILPGISGAFILVLLGAYKPVLDAIHNKDLITISILAVGAIVGLLTFSKILKWLFKKYHNLTLAVLTGFILGSLNKIWPWKRVLTWRINSHGEKVPFNEESISPFTYGNENNLLLAIILAVIGFLIIILLEKIATIKN